MKGIYLAACKARHFSYDIVYQDIDPKFHCDLGGDMLMVDLSNFDFIIATPPCNFWSRANPYYKRSVYSAITKHLLPSIILKCASQSKPFIIENVINKTRMTKYGVMQLIDLYPELNYLEVGRHCYISNTYIDFLKDVPQIQDFKYGGKRVNKDGYNQGGTNVFNVIEKWLEYYIQGNTLEKA